MSIFGSQVYRHKQQADGRQVGNLLKCRREAQVEGMCRLSACLDAQTGDVAEDVGRADGGCSARQPPGWGGCGAGSPQCSWLARCQRPWTLTSLKALLLHAGEPCPLTEVPSARPPLMRFGTRTWWQQSEAAVGDDGREVEARRG